MWLRYNLAAISSPKIASISIETPVTSGGLAVATISVSVPVTNEEPINYHDAGAVFVHKIEVRWNKNL